MPALSHTPSFPGALNQESSLDRSKSPSHLHTRMAAEPCRQGEGPVTHLLRKLWEGSTQAHCSPENVLLCFLRGGQANMARNVSQ